MVRIIIWEDKTLEWAVRKVHWKKRKEIIYIKKQICKIQRVFNVWKCYQYLWKWWMDVLFLIRSFLRINKLHGLISWWKSIGTVDNWFLNADRSSKKRKPNVKILSIMNYCQMLQIKAKTKQTGPHHQISLTSDCQL